MNNTLEWFNKYKEIKKCDNKQLLKDLVFNYKGDTYSENYLKMNQEIHILIEEIRVKHAIPFLTYKTAREDAAELILKEIANKYTLEEIKIHFKEKEKKSKLGIFEYTFFPFIIIMNIYISITGTAPTIFSALGILNETEYTSTTRVFSGVISIVLIILFSYYYILDKKEQKEDKELLK